MNDKNIMLLELGKKIADEISESVIKLSKNSPLGEEIGQAGASGHNTKIGDLHSEKIIINILKESQRELGFERIVLITEETGLVSFGNNSSKKGIFLVVDPIDGSNNLRPWKTPSPFVSFSAGIGWLENLDNDFSSIDVAIVKDIFNNRIYTAERGKGAWVEGFGKIHSSPEKDLAEAILGLDLENFSVTERKITELLEVKKCQRRLGSSILDFCKVAAGEYDGFVTLSERMGIYDLIAAKLIIEEAGGIFDLLHATENNVLQRMIEGAETNLLLEAKYKVVATGKLDLLKQIRKIVL